MCPVNGREAEESIRESPVDLLATGAVRVILSAPGLAPPCARQRNLLRPGAEPGLELRSPPARALGGFAAGAERVARSVARRPPRLPSNTPGLREPWDIQNGKPVWRRAGRLRPLPTARAPIPLAPLYLGGKALQCEPGVRDAADRSPLGVLSPSGSEVAASADFSPNSCLGH